MITIVYGREVLEVQAESEIACNIPIAIERWTGLPPSAYYCTQNGRRITSLECGSLRPDVPVRIVERLPGGKGGFGSMLRAIGAQIEKTTNREACRDLSGRRLRDINEEKRLKAYLEKQQEEGDGNERVKAERKISKLLSKPKHEFADSEYEHARSELIVAADEAIQEGLNKAIALEMGQGAEQEPVSKGVATGSQLPIAIPEPTGSRKRKHPDPKGTVQMKKGASKLWLSPDDLSSSSDTDEDGSSEENSAVIESNFSAVIRSAVLSKNCWIKKKLAYVFVI
ncbi:replication stress response regulator SDE2-like [Anopheles maculipalpis]|uniref:replication stress response regulator SDE2-like n=1 Tax=Anopheles maculipalpis TaxID=1496333 RepID=UPI00215901C5|nr:replication stress response regulator SDE2-like [Anopheles maculipalpis]